MPMFTNFGWSVIYREGLPLVKLHDPLITRPWKITLQIKSVTYSLLQCLKTPNLAG